MPLPFLPIFGEKEHSLFNKLLLSSNNSTKPNFDKISLQWCKHVDGLNIFPKLPVYLRLHFSNWQYNQRVKDAVNKSLSGEKKLK